MSSDTSQLDAQVHISRLDGGNYTIVDADPSTVNSIRNGLNHYEIAQLENVEVVDEPMMMVSFTDRCDANHTAKDTKYIYVGGKKKYRAKLQVRIFNFSFLWFNIHRASSQLKSRKKGWIFWYKHYTPITITQHGAVYESDYVYYPCVKRYWDSASQQWIEYTTICADEIECEGQGHSAYANINTSGWSVKVKRDYAPKVSASDKNGAPSTLNANFYWKGNLYNLSIF